MLPTLESGDGWEETERLMETLYEWPEFFRECARQDFQ
jgi:hypothetical protein